MAKHICLYCLPVSAAGSDFLVALGRINFQVFLAFGFLKLGHQGLQVLGQFGGNFLGCTFYRSCQMRADLSCLDLQFFLQLLLISFLNGEIDFHMLLLVGQDSLEVTCSRLVLPVDKNLGSANTKFKGHLFQPDTEVAILHLPPLNLHTQMRGNIRKCQAKETPFYRRLESIDTFCKFLDLAGVFPFIELCFGVTDRKNNSGLLIELKAFLCSAGLTAR